MKKLLFSLGLIALCFVACFVLRSLQVLSERNASSDGIPVTPSVTSYPALSEDESRARVIELLRTNAGCRLPCWWGIIPGKTRWETAHAFLSPMLNADGVSHRFISFSDRADSGTPERPILPELEMILRDSIIDDIFVSYIPGKYLTKLDLPHILREYGKPQEVYLRIFSYENNRIGDLYLHYPQLGIAIDYRYPIPNVVAPIRLCNLDDPQEADFYLWHDKLSTDLWDVTPSSPNDFYLLAGRVRWQLSGGFKILPLPEATSLTTDSFYQKFRSPEEHKACLETSADLWRENHY